MPQLQLQMLFSQTEEKQQKARLLKATVKEALEASPAYQQAKDAFVKSRTALQQTIDTLKQGFSTELGQIDDLKSDLEIDNDNLTAITLEKYRNGEGLDALTVEKDGVKYIPVFRVKFKKAEATEK